MPPKKRSRAGLQNYSKRKDIKSTGEDESNINSACVARGVRGDEGVGSGEVRVGSGDEGFGSGEVRVGSGDKGVGSDEVRVGSGEVGVGSGEVRVGSGRVEGESSSEFMVGTGSGQTGGDSDDVNSETC